jgi:hypothetical protein
MTSTTSVVLLDEHTGDLFSSITEENFYFFAVRYYNNSNCMGIEEFYKDIEKLKTIQRQLKIYCTNNDNVNTQLLLNNVICVFNVFEADAAKVMLFFKIKKEQWNQIATLIDFLGFFSQAEKDYLGTIGIEADEKLRQKLEEL